MRLKTGACVGLAILTIVAAVATDALAKPAAKPAPVAALTEKGERLAGQYEARLKTARDAILAALPAIDEAKKVAYLEAMQAEKAAIARLKSAESRLGAVAAASGLVSHAKTKWIGGADQGIAKATKALAAATTPDERAAAEKELAKWKANREDGVKALAEREAALAKAKVEEASATQEAEAARKGIATAKADALAALEKIGLARVLASDALDDRLATFVVLMEATPRGLAAFAEKSDENEGLVEKLLSNAALMKEMVVHDGAKDGAYGPAMKIYTDILRDAGEATVTGVLHELALAIALEHASPITQVNAASLTTAPRTIDPVKRYRHFAKAYREGELDPAFKTFDAWDLRFVVDGEEPDEILAWGRQMLRNYRPDHVTTPDYRWRYVEAVRTDVSYGSQDVKLDLPELQSFQNIIANGGVCGRRAFFGRFILRAFGIPTTARPQTGHAALVHWTPDGWVPNLGAAWGKGHTKTRYGSDLDFLATTQARENMRGYLEVKRAQWIGDALGEKRVLGTQVGEPGFWYGVSLYRQQRVIEDLKSVALAAVGEDIAESNVSKEPEVVRQATVADADRVIAVGADGTITIPAAACSKPTNSTSAVRFMPSVQGGMQLHYSRSATAEPFEYTFDAPAAGTYSLTAKVVTVRPRQHLQVVANGSGAPVDIEVPYTVGMWDVTPPVSVELVAGRNVLRFSNAANVVPRGVTIREFMLKPVR
jgi:hypothetical protein